MSPKFPTNVWGHIYRQNKEKSSRKQEWQQYQSLPAFNTFQNKTEQKKTWGALGDRRMDWDSLVDTVFREEIGKLAERFQRENK